MDRKPEMSRSHEPRVVCDGLVFHWRHALIGTLCGVAPSGPLTPASTAVHGGLTECPDCYAAAGRAIV